MEKRLRLDDFELTTCAEVDKSDGLPGLLCDFLGDRTKRVDTLHIGAYERYPFTIRHQEPAYSFTIIFHSDEGEHLIDLKRQDLPSGTWTNRPS